MHICTLLLFCTTHDDSFAFFHIQIFIFWANSLPPPNSLCCTPIFSPLLSAFAKMQRCVLRVVLPK